MPVSTSVHISHCLSVIGTANPKSVLDVGCGFGLWGFLCRMYLDVFHERLRPEDWQARIDGIELFEPYIQAHQRALYNRIVIGDIRALAPNIDEYDLIIAGDVIEHLDKDDGKRVLEQLYAKAKRGLLVNIPLGSGWDHPEAHGNPGELHRSQWCAEDFLAYPSHTATFQLPCGSYGAFYCPKDCSADVRASALLAAAEYADSLGNLSETVRLLRRTRDLLCGDRRALFGLVDAFLRSGEIDEAMDLLCSTVRANPADYETAAALSRLLATGAGARATRAAEARRILEGRG